MKELALPGELTQNRSYDFEFMQVEKPYESYVGANVRLRWVCKHDGVWFARAWSRACAEQFGCSSMSCQFAFAQDSDSVDGAACLFYSAFQPSWLTCLSLPPRYFLKVTIVRRLSDLVREYDLVVHQLATYPDVNNSIKMEVGIEDCLHIEFEYNKSK